MSCVSDCSTSTFSFYLASSSEFLIRSVIFSSSASCDYFAAIIFWNMPVIPISSRWIRLRLTTRPIVVYLLSDDCLKSFFIELRMSYSSPISSSSNSFNLLSEDYFERTDDRYLLSITLLSTSTIWYYSFLYMINYDLSALNSMF